MPQPKNDLGPEEREFLSRVRLPECPDAALVSACREGVLPEAQAQEIDRHVAECAICRGLLEDLDAIQFGTPSAAETVKIRQKIGHGEPRASQASGAGWFRKRWWVPALAVAACAVIAILLSRPSSSPSPSTVEVAQSKPLPQITVAKLPIHVDSSMLLATRGPGVASEPSGSELVKALSSYQKDNFAEAAQRLQALSEKYPQNGTVALYLGVSQLLLNRNDAAAKDLGRASELLEGTRAEDARWYLAAAELRLQQPTLALPALQQLCKGKSAYAAEACKIESQLK